MRIPSCECRQMPASTSDDNGRIVWICMNEDCDSFLQMIDPVWVWIAAFLPGDGLPPAKGEHHAR